MSRNLQVEEGLTHDHGPGGTRLVTFIIRLLARFRGNHITTETVVLVVQAKDGLALAVTKVHAVSVTLVLIATLVLKGF